MNADLIARLREHSKHLALRRVAPITQDLELEAAYALEAAEAENERLHLDIANHLEECPLSFEQPVDLDGRPMFPRAALAQPTPEAGQ